MIRAVKENGRWVAVGSRPGFYCWEHDRTIRAPRVQHAMTDWRGERILKGCLWFDDPTDAVDCYLTEIEVRV